MDRWRQKVAVVTGASSGLGADLARRLVEEGLQVVGLARRVERVQEISKELSTKGYSGTLHAIKCDVTIENDVVDAFKWIEDNLGPVHILVNNAGYMKAESIMDGSYSTWRQIMDTHVLGTTLCSRQALQQFRRHKVKGHIVIMNGILARKVCVQVTPIMNIYPCAKHALTALQELLTYEADYFQTESKVSTISPAMVSNTEVFTKANIPYLTDEICESMPHLVPKDVTDAIIYILSTPQNVQIKEIVIEPLGSKL